MNESTEPLRSAVVIDHDEPAFGLSALSGRQDHLESKLKKYTDNRNTFIRWLGAALVDGIDFGRIRICRPDAKTAPFRCDKRDRCETAWHWSKKTLFKPGAEKICGMLGLLPTWPSLEGIEHLAATGGALKSIVLRCELLDSKGRIVGQGIGGRTIGGRDDLNRALKMAKKSSLIDSVLSTAGLSELFTQDLDEMKTPETGDMFDKVDLCPIGPHKGRPLTELDEVALGYVLDNSDEEAVRERVKEILVARRRGETAEPVAEAVEAPEDADPGLSRRQAFEALEGSISLDELERAWTSTPEDFQRVFRSTYDKKRAQLGGDDHG